MMVMAHGGVNDDDKTTTITPMMMMMMMMTMMIIQQVDGSINSETGSHYQYVKVKFQ